MPGDVGSNILARLKASAGIVAVLTAFDGAGATVGRSWEASVGGAGGTIEDSNEVGVGAETRLSFERVGDPCTLGEETRETVGESESSRGVKLTGVVTSYVAPGGGS